MPAPAPVSTSTLWPWRVSSRTLLGTRPTRNSLFLISLGTPTRMGKFFLGPGARLNLLHRLDDVRRRRIGAGEQLVHRLAGDEVGFHMELLRIGEEGGILHGVDEGAAQLGDAGRRH